MISIQSLLLSLFLIADIHKTDAKTDASTLLTNHKPIPLVSIGLGKVQPNDIPDTLANSLGKTYLDYHLIDTEHISGNEKIIASTIAKKHLSENLPHVSTKVWYTHLGYERTKLSVRESLANLAPHVHVHVLLHWSRCDDDIPWMECEKEEANLSDKVKNTGPPPLNDYAFAYLQSWRALEELYLQHDEIVSIGVSNFSAEDWTQLLRNCNIVPHVHQGNVWTLFNDPGLMKLLDENNVLFQAYGVMSQVVSKLSDYPKVEERLTAITKKTNGVEKVGTLLLAWFVQNRIGVVVRSTNTERIGENAPLLVSMVPTFEVEEGKDIGRLIRHIVNEERVKLTFHNERNKKVHVYWVDELDALIKIDEAEAGEKTVLMGHPGQRFVVKDAGRGKKLNAFEVEAGYGQDQEFRVEL